MNGKFQKRFAFKFESIYLILLFALMAIAIIVKAYFNVDGNLSRDSCHYLALAQNLIEGNRLTIDNHFFVTWPIGYPFLIYLTAKLFFLPVFWASKVLNILLIGFTLVLLKVVFRARAYLYGNIFLFSSYLEIFSYSWSETVYIFCLISFATIIYQIVIKKPDEMFCLYVLIMFVSLLLFLSKYIGAFSFGVIGLLGLYHGILKKNKSVAIILIAIAIFNIMLMLGYLYNNYLETGFATGMERIPSLESHKQLFLMLVKAIIAETIIHSNSTDLKANLVFVMQGFIIGYFILANRKKIINPVEKNKIIGVSKLQIVFMTIGILHLFFIVLMRWINHFDNFNFRLLAPGSFLLFIAIINYIEKNVAQPYFKAFKVLLISVSLFSWFINVPLGINPGKTKSYEETIQHLKSRYSDVEPNSLVVFGSMHLKYLRTDICTIRPFFLPNHAEKENWDDFLNRVNPGHQKIVYFDTKEPQLKNDKYTFDKTVIELVNKYKHVDLVKLP